VQVKITNLIDDVQGEQTVRAWRWPDGIAWPSCEAQPVIQRGFDDTEPARQRSECPDCHTRFDDLTDTLVAGHHQPLNVGGGCLYCMGLHISHAQMAYEWALHGRDGQQRTTQLRDGIVKKGTSGPIQCSGMRRSLGERRP
jgi:transposase-like protein